MEEETIDNQKITFSCRVHPTDWWHEVGCDCKSWTNEELKNALITSKKSHQYLLNKIIKHAPEILQK
jgi:hypothetical protein